jgi:TRAP-type mannitol/chloroaromatic compound transport system substrate-binding protein
VNRQAWRRLPKPYQAMFSTACYEANLTMLSRYDQLNAQALQRLQRGRTQLEYFGDPILEQARAASEQMFADMARGDQVFAALLQQWSGFRAGVRDWNRINELSFANFSFAGPR